MKQGLLSVFVASATLGGSSVEADNAFPIIGIVAQPTWSALCPNGKSCEYVAASYVKFVESHGARAVPISYYTDDESANTLFESLNGVLFPGGANVKVPPVAHLMYNKAVAANAAGDVFPLWGTCLGFEWLVELAGGTLDGGFAAENVSLPLTMTDAAPTSTLFSGLDSGLYTMLQGEDTSAFNYHTMGITPAHFMATPSLAETFTVLSTSKDRKGKAFVSTMEAADPKLPFYGVQWHPEKNVWELGKDSNGNVKQAPFIQSLTFNFPARFTATTLTL
jgi:gamma-glutamyl hydrolase